MRRLWPVLTATLSLSGFLVSIYLTIEHYNSGLLVCGGGVFNCPAVLNSAQSTVFGIPTAAFGLVWFGVMFAFALAGRDPAKRPPLRLPLLAWSALGVLTVFYLVYTELYVVNALCLWCSVAHLLVLALFVLNLLAFQGE